MLNNNYILEFDLSHFYNKQKLVPIIAIHRDIKEYNKMPTIANITFPNRYLNAAGCWCTTANELIDLQTSESGGIVSKSCTEKPRDGNVQPRLHLEDTLSINSTGLANLGVNFYAAFGSALMAVPKTTKKPYIVSVAGVEHGENVRIVQTLREPEYACGIDLIELNLSCPNVAGKPQVGYDFEATRDVLRLVFESDDGYGPPLGVKLPPYFDQSHFKHIAEVLSDFTGKGAGGVGSSGHGLSFATCINSLGNGMVYTHQADKGDNAYQTAIAPNRGFGGVGGSVIKPFGLSNVAALHAELPHLPLIGCGGIASSSDADEYAHAGASLMQIGTALMKEGVGVFERLKKEEAILMS